MLHVVVDVVLWYCGLRFVCSLGVWFVIGFSLVWWLCGDFWLRGFVCFEFAIWPLGVCFALHWLVGWFCGGFGVCCLGFCFCLWVCGLLTLATWCCCSVVGLLLVSGVGLVVVVFAAGLDFVVVLVTCFGCILVGVLWCRFVLLDCFG